MKQKRYNLVFPMWMWDKILEIAEREGETAVWVITSALRTFFTIYEAMRSGKNVTLKIDETECILPYMRKTT